VRIRVVILASAMLPFLGGCDSMRPPSRVGQPTVQGESMRHMLADVDQIRAFVYGGSNQGEADKAANDLVSWSNRMAELFPPGPSATDYVDMSSERARNAPAAMSRAAASLLEAVRTGNRVAIGDQLSQTERDGCGFCHLSGSH
jgi:hypothetical protein